MSTVTSPHPPHQVNARINADGFGVGWYSMSVRGFEQPCCFYSITPAPNNRNLRMIAEHVQTSLLFAHIRASSGTPVSETNCHPFIFGRWMFMHNGAVAHFMRIKRLLTQKFSKDVFYHIEGTTDSEHVFMLFLDLLGPNRDDVQIPDIKEALLKTINIIVKLVSLVEQVDNKSHMASSLNLAITNGSIVIASRYRDGEEDPPSLYYHLFSKYECCHTQVAVHPLVGEDAGAVIISSEPVTQEPDGWILIPKNTLLTCNQDNKIQLEPITETNAEKYYQDWAAVDTNLL